MGEEIPVWDDRDGEAEGARRFLSGNESIARGAWEAGLGFAAAYPGTPSTEIVESLATLSGVTAQWSANEKVALECAVGASLGGVRALTAMKHVGLNVASDPLMTLGLTGVNAGLLIVSADDPGMQSSQNEQDNRNYARFAGTLLLEPSDSQECLIFARRGLELSEQHDLPVILRTSTPINHGKGAVTVGKRKARAALAVPRDPSKWVMLPAMAQARRRAQLERLAFVEAHGHELGLHVTEDGDGPVGIVTSGVCYQYVKEAAPDAPVLKLGLTHPVPVEAVLPFASRYAAILVVEELDPFLESWLRASGFHARGKEYLPAHGELDAVRIRAAYEAACAGAPSRAAFVHRAPQAARAEDAGPTPSVFRHDPRIPLASDAELPPAPGRPPVLCPACPYRGVLRAFRRKSHFVFGDIGCSTLGALVPHETIHFTLCMGASISAAAGFSRVRPGEKAIALIGDSTFLHSGMPALLDAVYNRADLALVILDNCAIAMTGGQPHPGTGGTLAGEAGAGVDYEALIRALGVARVTTVDPYEGELFARTLGRDMETPGPTVIVARRPCVLVDRTRLRSSAFVNTAMCTGCGDCLEEGCPALSRYRNGRQEDKVRIDRDLCIGCPDCSQVCEPGAISWFPELPVLAVASDRSARRA